MTSRGDGSDVWVCCWMVNALISHVSFRPRPFTVLPNGTVYAAHDDRFQMVD
ncbi:MAG: hypothetical protein IRZ33_10435 [Alicyclobacillaceae bacterium]|nr:hypothetical protein [Alicyclobacillaceae bacterium]